MPELMPPQSWRKMEMISLFLELWRVSFSKPLPLFLASFLVYS